MKIFLNIPNRFWSVARLLETEMSDLSFRVYRHELLTSVRGSQQLIKREELSNQSVGRALFHQVIISRVLVAKPSPLSCRHDAHV